MLGSLRRYDVQATYASLSAIAGAVPCGVAAFLAWQRYSNEFRHIVYGSKGLFLPAFAVCLLVSLLLAGVAFVLGWNSAGQRRNDKQSRSWFGFFVGGTVVTLDVVLLIAFYVMRMEKPM